MKLTDCLIAAVVSYVAIAVSSIVLGIFWFIIPIPFYLVSLSALVVAPLIMGFILGLRWPQRTIAYDEIIPACLKTLLIFGVPLLLAPQLLPYYLLALPVTICCAVIGAKIGISARHHRLIDELLGRWSIGEK
jgi:hypothetical protein